MQKFNNDPEYIHGEYEVSHHGTNRCEIVYEARVPYGDGGTLLKMLQSHLEANSFVVFDYDDDRRNGDNYGINHFNDIARKLGYELVKTDVSPLASYASLMAHAHVLCGDCSNVEYTRAQCELIASRHNPLGIDTSIRADEIRAELLKMYQG